MPCASGWSGSTRAVISRGPPGSPADGMTMATACWWVRPSVNGSDMIGPDASAGLDSHDAPAWLAPAGAPFFTTDEHGTRPDGRTRSMCPDGKTPTPAKLRVQADGLAKSARVSSPVTPAMAD